MEIPYKMTVEAVLGTVVSKAEAAHNDKLHELLDEGVELAEATKRALAFSCDVAKGHLASAKKFFGPGVAVCAAIRGVLTQMDTETSPVQKEVIKDLAEALQEDITEGSIRDGLMDLFGSIYHKGLDRTGRSSSFYRAAVMDAAVSVAFLVKKVLSATVMWGQDSSIGMAFVSGSIKGMVSLLSMTYGEKFAVDVLGAAKHIIIRIDNQHDEGDKIDLEKFQLAKKILDDALGDMSPSLFAETLAKTEAIKGFNNTDRHFDVGMAKVMNHFGVPIIEPNMMGDMSGPDDEDEAEEEPKINHGGIN